MYLELGDIEIKKTFYGDVIKYNFKGITYTFARRRKDWEYILPTKIENDQYLYPCVCMKFERYMKQYWKFKREKLFIKCKRSSITNSFLLGDYEPGNKLVYGPITKSDAIIIKFKITD